jgi:hypothetical protein
LPTSRTATDSFKLEAWDGSESTENDDVWEFVAGRLPSLCIAEQRLGDQKVQDNGEVEVLLHEVW